MHFHQDGKLCSLMVVRGILLESDKYFLWNYAIFDNSSSISCSILFVAAFRAKSAKSFRQDRVILDISVLK